MKQLRKSMVIVFMLLVVLGNTLMVSASSADDVLIPYQNRLDEINEKLGTNYKLASEDELKAVDSSMNMLTDFFIKMDLDQFEDYIVDLHNNSEFEEPADCVKQNDIMLLADDSKQFYFYDKVHWFYLDTKTITVNNIMYYNSFVDAGSGFDLTETYPQYSAYNYDYSTSADSRKMEVTYYCTKYLSKYVTDATKYTVKHTYTAGESD
ncbi:MAG: hypothetical protein K2O91_17870 [Lachnospiraceae bacterium]|nr:hypothetical protein [Lachnospiraceae bacterium]